MHLNKEWYGIEIYDLLECVDLNISDKQLTIDALLNWAKHYITFSSVTIYTIKTRPHTSIDFNYDSGVPKQWIEEYINNDYAMDDPIVKYALSVGGVFSWNKALSRFDTPRGRNVIEHARTHGLHRGYSYTMPASNKQDDNVELLSIANVSSKSSVASKYIVATLGATIFYIMKNADEHSNHNSKPHLNNSELQALDWSAKGKSIWEISQITNTSERTVKYHLINAYRKLQVSNKTQAVSTALKLGLLD